MLFGMFFGAGNLIFPVSMGQQAGANLWPAVVGFCLTGVGLPLLGIAAMASSRSEGLFEMCRPLGKGYSYFFTCLLYLSIGPLFAIPRTATVSFSVGILPILPERWSGVALPIFSALFFLVVWFFAMRPSGIMVWIGKFLNPTFLLFLSILTVTALLSPMGDIAAGTPTGSYVDASFFQGFLDGYNTVDALAALAFGIVLINAVRELGVTSPEAIAGSTLKAGILSSALMAAIYCVLTVVGAQSRPVLGINVDGGEALFLIGRHYFGTLGGGLLGITVTFACLKTAIGLSTSCAETFVTLFPKSLSYRAWATIFCLFAFGVANVGLSTIIELSLPVLMFLYPLTITLILLSLFGKWFHYDRRVYLSVTACTLVVALLDFLHALPAGARSALRVEGLLEWAKDCIPLFSIGMGWVLPACIGLAVGLFLHKRSR